MSLFVLLCSSAPRLVGGPFDRGMVNGASHTYLGSATGMPLLEYLVLLWSKQTTLARKVVSVFSSP